MPRPARRSAFMNARKLVPHFAAIAATKRNMMRRKYRIAASNAAAVARLRVRRPAQYRAYMSRRLASFRRPLGLGAMFIRPRSIASLKRTRMGRIRR